MFGIEKKNPIFHKLEDAQGYYLHYIYFGGKEFLSCKYLNDEISSEEFCKDCQQCLYKNSEEAKAKRKRKNLKVLTRTTTDLMCDPPDTFVERQRNRKNALGLASIAYQMNPETGRKLKESIKKTHYTLTKDQAKVVANNE